MNPVHNDPPPDVDDWLHAAGSLRASVDGAMGWLDRIDPGAHRRIKGLRLVTAYGIAAMLGTMADIARGLPNGAALSSLAGGFALWASVSEGRGTRAGSTRDLVLLSAAAALGAASYIVLAPLLQHLGRAGPELTLAIGAFLVGYLRRFGVTGTGIGSQVYIGQLLAYGARPQYRRPSDCRRRRAACRTGLCRPACAQRAGRASAAGPGAARCSGGCASAGTHHGSASGDRRGRHRRTERCGWAHRIRAGRSPPARTSLRARHPPRSKG